MNININIVWLKIYQTINLLLIIIKKQRKEK